MSLLVMSQSAEVILKDPVLLPSEDYYRLRREGIGFIEEMGSRHWTDYNTHDPGITILEALCYAITDLSFRMGWKIEDILSPQTPSSDPENPYPLQAFYTARKILTNNPWTPDDFRRFLIDLDLIRNAWVLCKSCACDLHYFSWCELDELKYGYDKPANVLPEPVRVVPKGLYDIYLELEADILLGDLNDRKIEKRFFVFDDDGKPHTGIIEVRFPQWGLEKWNEWEMFLQKVDAFASQNGESFQITLINTSQNRFPDITLLSETEFKRNWRNLYTVSFALEFLPGGEIIPIEAVSVRIFGDDVIKNNSTRDSIIDFLKDITTSGFIQQYRFKLLRVEDALRSAKEALHVIRNLDEDYCTIKPIDVEDIGICADIELEPNADIESIQAQVWFEIERYLNPPIDFYSLKELMDEQVPVEEIFNGPALENGFIKSANLEAADLKSIIKVSDLINILMDIKGIVAVNNVLVTKYDHEGQVVKGSADPQWINDVPLFDANKISARWLMFVSDLHQPRLYRNLSQFLFFKNGLPFTPRQSEANEVYIQLKGQAERPKLKGIDNDLHIPAGKYADAENYFPVQYSFPMTYGIGPEGLPSHVNLRRRAEAKQLKAYLLVYEQLIGNTLSQLAHTADLFSLDTGISKTYFTKQFNDAIISGFSEITKAGYNTIVAQTAESPQDFLVRRNLFLDHLLARFGETFDEYALMLTNWQGQQTGLQQLIDDKISFLKSYPAISHDRGKSFNYRVNPCDPENISGLKKKISLLLGYPDLHFQWVMTETIPGTFEITQFQLKDAHNIVWLDGQFAVSASSVEEVEHLAFRKIIRQLVQSDAYNLIDNSPLFHITVDDANGNEIATSPKLFGSKDEALFFIQELMEWASQVRSIVVEHILLRPKFPGDALYPACIEGSCATCGDEDPYSFRLTIVMPGWSDPYNYNLDMRRFADRTIREQVPSHLVSKVCWVGNEGFSENPCDPIVFDMAELIQTKTLTASGERPTDAEACDCANAIYAAITDEFRQWYTDKTLLFFHPAALETELNAVFNSIDPSGLSCNSDLVPVWPEILNMLVIHFSGIVQHGWQFEKFETAWCEWLHANALIDWTEEKLYEHVEAILKKNYIRGPVENLCACADSLLTKYGTSFYEWMEANLSAGHSFEELTDFVPDPVQLCSDFSFAPNTADIIEVLLEHKYSSYKEVSYHLWRVVSFLSQLRNTYPGATLHDCDDGSDDNPVRLDSTGLGNYPIKRAQVIPGSETRRVGDSRTRIERREDSGDERITSERVRVASSLAKKAAAKKTPAKSSAKKSTPTSTDKKKAAKKAAKKTAKKASGKKPPKKS